MKRTWKCSLLMLALIYLEGACSHSNTENQQSIQEAEQVGVTNLLEKASDLAKAAEQSQKAADDRAKQRIERGDTLAMPYTELAKFLPNELDGFKAEGEPQGESSNTAGMSVSSARKRLLRGKDYLYLEISDYNGGVNVAAQNILAMFSMAAEISMETGDMQQIGFKQGEDIKGSIIYHKGRQVAELSAVIANRFLLKMEANNQQDAEKLKQYFQQLPLATLASR
ncbi:MAG: hypothetical protein RMJ87_05305 [Cytophagales bacterium]|nr:hypothetical protein [Bernardetiaceae bacterium]MDW8204426.1 hypothetical protein [Cytophagales bacterium]